MSCCPNEKDHPIKVSPWSQLVCIMRRFSMRAAVGSPKLQLPAVSKACSYCSAAPVPKILLNLSRQCNMLSSAGLLRQLHQQLQQQINMVFQLQSSRNGLLVQADRCQAHLQQQQPPGTALLVAKLQLSGMLHASISWGRGLICGR